MSDFKVTTDVTYLVRVSEPRYCQITDAYRGQKVTIAEAFSFYEEACEYVAENYNEHEVNFDDVVAYVTVDITTDREDVTYGKEYTVNELHANSYYTGPSDWTEEVPF